MLGKTAEKLSEGMKRKLTIAAGILCEPEIVFLDEPTTGIDVESARQIRNLVLDLNRKGTTIFLTIHYIEEAERLCARIGFIVEDEIVKLGKVDELMVDVQKENIVQFILGRWTNAVKNAFINAFPQFEAQTFSDFFRFPMMFSCGLFIPLTKLPPVLRPV